MFGKNGSFSQTMLESIYMHKTKAAAALIGITYTLYLFFTCQMANISVKFFIYRGVNMLKFCMYLHQKSLYFYIKGGYCNGVITVLADTCLCLVSRRGC